MAPPAKSQVKPPQTLPADFFDQQNGGVPTTLPANFFDGTEQPRSGYDTIPRIQNEFDTLTAHQPYTPVHSAADLGKNAITAASNFGAGVFGLASPLVHPLQTLRGMGSQPKFDPVDLLGPAGRPLKALGKEIMSGRGAEAIPQIASAFMVPESAEEVSAFRDPLKAYRSPLIGPEEAGARAAADVIRPNPLEYRRTVGNLEEGLPYIRDVRSRFRNPLEFSKAATQAGKTQSGFFKEQFIDPDEMELGPIYQQVSNINDKLRPMYRARTMGEQLTKEAQDHMQELEAQRDALNDQMYDRISMRTGLPREQIQGINQRGAKLQQIGDVADTSQAMRRSGFSGYTPSGLPIPMTSMERAMRLLSYIRGGPEAAAGRKLTRIMGQVAGEAEPLPNVENIRTYRNLAQQEELAGIKNRIAQADLNQAGSEARKPEGLGPTERPGPPTELNPESYLRNRELRKNIRQTLQRAKMEKVTGGNRAPVFSVESTPPVLTPRLKALLERGLPTK